MSTSFLSILLLFVTTQSRNATEGTYGCLESSNSDLDGNYTLYQMWNNHSIWIKETIGETYVIYFDTALGEQEYQAFGIYYCQNANAYIDTVDQMTEKNPGLVMDCQGKPAVFCPALTSADASQLSDGMGTTSGKLNYIYIQDFFSCGTWFEYVDEMYPSSTASISFDTEWCVSSSKSNTGGNGNGNVGSGGTTHIGSDKETKSGMSATAMAILWTICGIFIILCIVAISYYVYKWREKKLLSEEQNVALTEEKEEDKFEKDTGLVGDEPVEEDNTKDVVV